MVKAGKTHTVEVLKLLKAFEDESDYNVWSSIVNILVRLNQILSHTEFKDQFTKVSSNKQEKSGGFSSNQMGILVLKRKCFL